jgi:hypothetical protein
MGGGLIVQYQRTFTSETTEIDVTIDFVVVLFANGRLTNLTTGEVIEFNTVQ